MNTANNSNVTQPAGLDVTGRNMHFAVMLIYCAIFAFGTFGNGLVIYVTGFRMKRTVNSVWFLNLALADFMFTTFLIFSIISISNDQQWHLGGFMCKLNSLVNVLNMFASIFFLTAISLDRCLSIWAVAWAQNKRTVRKAQLMCAVIWVTAVVCSTPYATFRKLLQGQNYCIYLITETQYRSLLILRIVVGFLIPFLVIFACYMAIAIRARRLQRTRKRRPHRIIFSIILAFFICWLPFHVMQLIELKFSHDPYVGNVIRIVGPLTVCLAFLNSCLNPILYVFMCDEFQKKIKQSIFLVLESALAENQTSFMSSRFFSSQFSRKSDSAAPGERKDTATSLTFTESKVIITEERETMSSD